MLAQAVCFHVLAVCAMLTSGDRGSLTVAHSAFFKRTKHRTGGDPFEYDDLNKLTDHQQKQVAKLKTVLEDEVDSAAQKAEESSIKLAAGISELHGEFGILKEGVAHLIEVTQNTHKRLVGDVRDAISQRSTHHVDQAREDLHETGVSVSKKHLPDTVGGDHSHSPPEENKGHHLMSSGEKKQILETAEKLTGDSFVTGSSPSAIQAVQNKFKDDASDLSHLDDRKVEDRMRQSVEVIANQQAEELKMATMACFHLAGSPTDEPRSCNSAKVKDFFKPQDPCEGDKDLKAKCGEETDNKCKVRYVCVEKANGGDQTKTVVTGKGGHWEVFEDDHDHGKCESGTLEFVCTAKELPCNVPPAEHGGP